MVVRILDGPDPFGLLASSVLAVDALFIFTTLVLYIAMMSYEGGGYLKSVHGGDYSGKEMIGIAIWMLIGRVLSSHFCNEEPRFLVSGWRC